jgi:hypothetical protein
VTPPGFQLPEGGDCSAKIARYRAVQDNDLSMGHVAQSVYNQIKRETDAAQSVCAAGRDAEAKAMIAASEKRHGYPTELCANASRRYAATKIGTRASSMSPGPRTTCMRENSA